MEQNFVYSVKLKQKELARKRGLIKTKDKTFKIIYHRTDSGCLLIWVYHGEKLISMETVFSDNRLWFESWAKPESFNILFPNSFVNQKTVLAKDSIGDK
jgi:hypothetical protein